jgi:flagellar export protein FliJ
MRKFRFRLQSLENIKGLELDALKQTLAAAQAAVRKAEEALLATRDALNDAYNELAALRHAGRTDSTILLSLESYAGLLRDQLRAQAQRVVTLRREMESARAQLVAKHQEKKVLEKYHERQYERYSHKVETENQKDLDETASNVYQQKQP